MTPARTRSLLPTKPPPCPRVIRVYPCCSVVKKNPPAPRRFPRRFTPLTCFLALGLLSLALTPLASAHPIRTSYAEADYRPETKKLEIALRVYPDDLEAALTAHAGQPISVARTPPPAFDVALLAYLRATFLLRAADGTAPTLHLAGRELKDNDQHLWIYFECNLPGGLAGTRLSHRVLRDAFPSNSTPSA